MLSKHERALQDLTRAIEERDDLLREVMFESFKPHWGAFGTSAHRLHLRFRIRKLIGD